MTTEATEKQNGITGINAAELLARLLDRLAEFPPPPMTLTQDELARELRVDERTIRRWDKGGKLPKAIRLGDGEKTETKTKRWRRDAIMRWLAAMKPDGTLPNLREWQAIEEQRARDEIARR